MEDDLRERKNNIIAAQRDNMIDEDRVQLALKMCASVFDREHLNFSEVLEVAELMLINLFSNAAESSKDKPEELLILKEIVMEYFPALAKEITGIFIIKDE